MIELKDLEKFTYDVYTKLLDTLSERYRLIQFSQTKHTNPPYVVLRHDVDFSLDAALRMAKLEKSMNVLSTYSVLLSHKLYNIFEQDSVKILKQIRDLGHEIILHYDPELYEKYHIDYYTILNKQLEILGLILGTQIDTVARHKNSLKVTYNPFPDHEFFTPGGQIVHNADFSQLYDLTVKDPCRMWNKRFIERLFTFEDNRIQLLTHPCMWTYEEVNKQQCLEMVFSNASKSNEDYYRSCLDVWKECEEVWKNE